MIWAQRLAAFLFMISVPVALILGNVRLVAQEQRVYSYSFQRYDAARVTGIARAELERAAAEIIDYFDSEEEWLDIKVVKEGQLVPLFNAREVLHMRDVKLLFQRVFRIQEAALLYSLTYVALVIIWARERSPRELAQQMQVIGAGMGILVLIAGVSIALGFDRLFEQFHLLSFRNDFWRLDPSRDHLIQMFPQGFWFDVTAFIAFLTFLEAGVIVLLSSLYLHRWLPVARRAPSLPSEVTPSGVAPK